jgi:hypothetical protein
MSSGFATVDASLCTSTATGQFLVERDRFVDA